MKSQNNCFNQLSKLGFMLLISLFLALPLSSNLHAVEVTETQLLPELGASGDKYGWSVSLDGNRALVGAYDDDEKGVDAGAAYIFELRNGKWVQVQKLTAGDIDQVGDGFGWSVSLDGDRALVGAYLADGQVSNSGAAYIFELRNNNWIQVKKLTASLADEHARFGHSVSIDGNRALISAERDDERGSNAGAAYIFERQADGDWVEIDKLTPSIVTQYNNYFGSSVSLDGSRALIGADNYDQSGENNTGFAYIFERQENGDWVEVNRLIPESATSTSFFGSSVSLYSDHALIGATGGRDAQGRVVGSAYIFERLENGSWVQKEKLLGSEATHGGQFGQSVSLYGERALVGQQNYLSNDVYGDAYLFERQNDGSWLEILKLSEPSDLVGNSSEFASAVSLDGNRLLVGAYLDSAQGVRSGSVYLYDLDSGGGSWGQSKLVASDGAAGDWFGYSTSLDGVFTVIGAPWDDDQGQDSGSAYVFERQIDGSWLEVDKLLPADGASEDEFGWAVSLSGRHALVGAAWNDDQGTDSGSAYIFERQTDGHWLEVEKVLSSDGSSLGHFGRSVSISGERALIGSEGKNRDTGAAYIYERQTDGSWHEVEKLIAEDSDQGDLFGWAVRLNGDRALVGARLDDENGTDSGAVYIFERQSDGQWLQTQKLVSSDGALFSEFGFSVNLFGNRVIVGAVYHDDNGAAFIFDRQADGSWLEVQKLSHPSNPAQDVLGTSVSLYGERAYVGSPLASNAGLAYLYESHGGDGWGLDETFTAADGAANDWFGFSGSLYGNLTIIGSPRNDNDLGIDAGAAYLFELSEKEFSLQSGQADIDHTWESTTLQQNFSEPVIIVGPPTYHGFDPGVVRLRNVTDSSFEMRFQEWDYLDGSHAKEDVPYLALEEGRYSMPDGTVVEVGRFALSGTGQFNAQNFTETFPEPPRLFLTVQTYNGGQAVTVRARNLSSTGFEAALFEQEDLMDGHATETIGYLAIYSPSGMGTLVAGSTSLSYDLFSTALNHNFAQVDNSALKLEEEQSKDDELVHTNEWVAIMRLDDKFFAQDVSCTGRDTVALRRNDKDTDGDGLVDVVDPDNDNDGIPDPLDPCPLDAENLCINWGEAGLIAVNHDWKTVQHAGVFEQPVVIAGPPTYHGGDPGVVRVDNVTEGSFELRFQEWDYRDGWHANEDVPYVVLESGHRSQPDGTIIEAGTFDLSGTGEFLSKSFSQEFADIPWLFLTLQTYNGNEAVTVRARNLTAAGFEAALFEQEALMDGHPTERIGYLAIHSPQGSGRLKLEGLNEPYVLQSELINHQFTPVLSHALKFEEEQSFDDEVGHIDEALDIMVLGDKLFAQDVSCAGGDTAALRRRAPEYATLMEWGTVDGIAHTWETIPLAKHYDYPVVVVKPVSYKGPDSGVIRTRNVDGDSFEVKYDEWSYLDGGHAPERLFYLVAEEGYHDLAGLLVAAANITSNKVLDQGQWESFIFEEGLFAEAPAIFSAVSSSNGGDPVVSRVHDVSEFGFDVSMQEEEAKSDGHTKETLSIIIIEKGSGVTSDNRAIRLLDAKASDMDTTIDFGHTFSLRFPVVVGDISSTFGPDPCVLRYQNLTRSSVDLFLQEEQSFDTETSHVVEDLSIFVAE